MTWSERGQSTSAISQFCHWIFMDTKHGMGWNEVFDAKLWGGFVLTYQRLFASFLPLSAGLCFLTHSEVSRVEVWRLYYKKRWGVMKSQSLSVLSFCLYGFCCGCCLSRWGFLTCLAVSRSKSHIVFSVSISLLYTVRPASLQLTAEDSALSTLPTRVPHKLLIQLHCDGVLTVTEGMVWSGEQG